MKGKRGILERLEARLVLASGPLLISEFMANNDGTLADVDGDFSDWIEVRNPTDAEVNVDGWYLTDDERDLTKWRFPDVRLGAGDYLVVFASSKDRRDPAAELHTNFRLSSSGEYLALVEPDGRTVPHQFSPSYPRQFSDYSYGTVDQAQSQSVFKAGDPTYHIPTSADDVVGTEWASVDFDDPSWNRLTEAPRVLITEVGTASIDFVEIQNVTDGSLDTAGWFVVINQPSSGSILEVHPITWKLPDVLAPGEILYRTDQTDDHYWGDDISWRTTRQGWVMIVDDRGQVADFFVWGYDTAGLATLNVVVEGGEIALEGAWSGSPHTGNDSARSSLQRQGSADHDTAPDWEAKGPPSPGKGNQGLATPLALDISTSIGFDAAATGLQESVHVDVEAQMHGVQSSLWVRYPFEVDDPSALDTLQLNVAYNDGFVAFINGREVARRNAPETLRWDSAATAARSVEESLQVEQIEVSAALGTLQSGENVLAIQSLNVHAADANMLILPELQASSRRYFLKPTPGRANGEGVRGFVADTRFSVDRGFFTGPFDLEITTATAGAEVFYTTDGSEPQPGGAGSILYTRPIRIESTTTLRAAAYRAGYEPTNVDTQTYIFPAHVAQQPARPPGTTATWSGGFPADYQLDPEVVNSTLPGYSFDDALRSVPTVSLVFKPGELFSASRGVYYNSSAKGSAWERAVSIEWIRPDQAEEFQIDAGVRVHGGSSRNHGFTPKHSLRLFFRDEYGAGKLDFPIFGDYPVDRFDQLVLRGCSTDSWPVVDGGPVLGVQRWRASNSTYLRDQWIRDALRDTGQVSANGVYVHLYLNGLYWGLYNLAERPLDSFNAEHLGGDKDEYDVIHDRTEVQAGDMVVWNQMMSLAAAGLGSEAAYQRFQGNNPDGTPNPAFPVYLDVGNLIDYMIVHIYSGAEDWPDHNWWSARRRGPESEGFKFFAWDQEISNDSLVRTHTRISTRFENPISQASPSYLYGRLLANDTFRRRFTNRVQELLFDDGPLTPEANSARWMARQTEIDQAIVAESARWGDSKRAVPYKRETDWLAEMDWMANTYWPQIHDIALDRFRRVGLFPDVESPEFSKHGGEVLPDFALELTVPEGTIYYTLDGSDPRTESGQPQGIRYSGPFVIDKDTVIKARAFDGSDWSMLSEAEFTVRGAPLAGSLMISELNYHPYAPTPDEQALGFLDSDRFEFIELTNVGETPIDLTGMSFGGGVELTVAPRTDGPRVLISEVGTGLTDYVEIQNVNNGPVDTSGWFVVLNNPTSGSIHEVHPIVWTLPDEMDLGDVLYRTDDPDDHYWGNGISWKTTRNGWAMLVDAQDQIADFVVWGYEPADVASLQIHVDDHEFRLAEAWNGPAVPAEGGRDNSLQRSGAADRDDASDWAFVEPQSMGEANADLTVFTSARPVILEPGACAVIVHEAEAFAARYGSEIDVVGQYRSELDNRGDNLKLFTRGGFLVFDFSYSDSGTWPDVADGRGASLELVDPTAVPLLEPERTAYLESGQHWRASTHSGGTPGWVDQSAIVVDRYVFYNGSAFDANDPAANAEDDAAIAPDKQALMPSQTATFANYTSYSRGINGIIVDIANLAGPLTAADFRFKVGNDATPANWEDASIPSSVTVRPGDGVGGSNRVTIIWPDDVIRSRWLQVTVLSTTNTGLFEDDVFYFGNSVAEAGDSTLNSVVNATDEIVARNFQHGPTNLAAIDDPYDYNRDRLVNATDRTIARNNQTGPRDTLRLITAPALGVAMGSELNGTAACGVRV